MLSYCQGANALRARKFGICLHRAARLFTTLLVLFVPGLRLMAQNTAFAYKGQLLDAGQPASGFYELQFRLTDSSTDGNYVGPTVSTVPVVVSNGSFVVSLDFGAAAFDGSARWLEMSVRTNGGATYTVLAPRQPITATPYAVFAASAASVGTPIPVSQLSGVLSLAQLPGSVVTVPQLAQSNAYQGSFTGDLSGSSNVASAVNFTVSGSLSAGVILNSELADVTGIPPQEAIVASWAPQPFLGYNPWYDFATCPSLRAHTTSNFLAAAATQWATNGLLEAGWNWFTIDDTWQAFERVDGHVAEDLTRFPGGIKGLVDYLHQLGFKVMIYTSFPRMTCCGYPGTGIADIGSDVTYFAQCGFDGIKIDSCLGPFSGTYGLEEVGTRLFASAIYRTGRPMALCMNYPDYPPYPQYLRYQDNCFSVWADNATEFPSGLQIFTNADLVLNYHTNFMAPGHFTFGGAVNCAALGLSELTNILSFLALEQCMMPCGMPRDGSQITLMTNSEVLAVANDPGVVPPRRVWDNGQLAAWIKPLGSASSNTNMLALINRTTNSVTLGVAWADVGIFEKMTVRDVWEHRTLGDYSLGFSNAIPAQAVRLYKLWPQNTDLPYTGTVTFGTNTVVIRNGVIIDVQ